MRAAILFASLVMLAPPEIGVVRDCSGHVRRVYGSGGAFVMGGIENLELPPEAADARVEGRVLILHRADGSEQRVPLPERAAEVRRMGPGWLAAPPFAIQVTADSAMVYRLPMKACAAAEAAR